MTDGAPRLNAHHQLCGSSVFRPPTTKLGVTAIATLHGETLKVTYSNDVFFPLLGLATNTLTGVITKLSPPCFSLAIVVVAKGRCIVFPDLEASITELLNGGNPQGVKVGTWPEL